MAKKKKSASDKNNNVKEKRNQELSSLDTSVETNENSADESVVDESEINPEISGVEQNDSIENEIDSYIDEDELQAQKELAEIEDMLRTSRSKRLKAQKDEKLAQKIKKEAEKAKEQDANKKPIKLDPIAIGALCLAVVALIGGIIFFVLKLTATPTLEMTMKEFQTKYESTELYGLLKDYGYTFPTIQYSAESNETNADGSSVQNKKLDFFTGSIPNQFNTIIGVTGSTLKSNDDIKVMRICSICDENFDYQRATVVYGSYIQALYPDMTSEEAINYVSDLYMLSDNSENNAAAKQMGEYAVAVSVNVVYGEPCFVMDIMNADDASDYEF